MEAGSCFNTDDMPALGHQRSSGKRGCAGVNVYRPAAERKLWLKKLERTPRHDYFRRCPLPRELELELSESAADHTVLECATAGQLQASMQPSFSSHVSITDREHSWKFWIVV